MTRLHMIKNLLEPAQLRRLPGFDSDAVKTRFKTKPKSFTGSTPRSNWVAIVAYVNSDVVLSCVLCRRGDRRGEKYKSDKIRCCRRSGMVAQGAGLNHNYDVVLCPDY